MTRTPATGNEDGASPRSRPIGGAPGGSISRLAGWLGRHAAALLAGAVPGILIGLWAGDSQSKGDFYVLGAQLAGGAVVLLLIVFLTVATVGRRPDMGIAALALGGAYLVGFVVSPGAPGDPRSAGGTGTVRSPEGTILASARVECGWLKGERAVEHVSGFYVPFTGLEDFHPLEDGLSVDIWVSDQMLVYMGHPIWQGGLPISIGGASSDGRSGTAVLVARTAGTNTSTRSPMAEEMIDFETALIDAGFVFQWSCSGGP